MTLSIHSFLLDTNVIFLNHGSFGACPKSVFEAYQGWQRRLESQPVLFLGRELAALEAQARRILGIYLNADSNDLVFIPNATHGVNIVARSLALGPGDEILASDHEYGACDNTWNFVCRKTGATIKRLPISLPIESSEAFVEQLWQGVTPRTRLIYLSHITSPTAQRFPIEIICQRARQAGILTLVDGAHAPGQIFLDLPVIGADFYTGNCHKWMLSPKGAAFLFARKEVQHLIEPLVVSWGYSADDKTTTGSRFIDILQWTGTHDPAAALSVPVAIRFMEMNNWNDVRRRCTGLLLQALGRIREITGLPAAYPDHQDGMPHSLPPQMGVARLPRIRDLAALKSRLYDEYHIEVPLIEWNEQHWIRISVQGYNTQEDIDTLVQALSRLLPEMRA